MIDGMTRCEKSLDRGTLDGEYLTVFNVILAWVRIALVDAICEGSIVCHEVGYTPCVIAVPVREQDMGNIEVSFFQDFDYSFSPYWDSLRG